jgi:hypothetical protein
MIVFASLKTRNLLKIVGTAQELLIKVGKSTNQIIEQAFGSPFSILSNSK